MIALENAHAIDFEFLGLNPLSPRMHRLQDDNAEYTFCQRLLLTGAKWWDSEARRSFAVALEVGGIDRGVRINYVFRLVD
jgi:hypothetical protein